MVSFASQSCSPKSKRVQLLSIRTMRLPDASLQAWSLLEGPSVFGSIWNKFRYEMGERHFLEPQTLSSMWLILADEFLLMWQEPLISMLRRWDWRWRMGIQPLPDQCCFSLCHSSLSIQQSVHQGPRKPKDVPVISWERASAGKKDWWVSSLSPSGGHGHWAHGRMEDLLMAGVNCKWEISWCLWSSLLTLLVPGCIYLTHSGPGER